MTCGHSQIADLGECARESQDCRNDCDDDGPYDGAGVVGGDCLEGDQACENVTATDEDEEDDFLGDQGNQFMQPPRFRLSERLRTTRFTTHFGLLLEIHDRTRLP